MNGAVEAARARHLRTGVDLARRDRLSSFHRLSADFVRNESVKLPPRPLKGGNGRPAHLVGEAALRDRVEEGED
jgi:hypothetical protein